MKSNTDCNSSYLYSALIKSSREKVVNGLIENIRNFGLNKFDTIVFRGISGALIAPVVADILDKPMAFVRKKDESHSTLNFEGNRHIKNFIIIDDMIYSGETMRRIITSVKEFNKEAECIGIFLYRHCGDETSYWSWSHIKIPVFSFYVS